MILATQALLSPREISHQEYPNLGIRQAEPYDVYVRVCVCMIEGNMGGKRTITPSQIPPKPALSSP